MSATLYGARGGLATTSDLYTIDPATGAVTSIGPMGYALGGLAWDPTDLGDTNLYGATTAASAVHPKSLVRINRLTGAATFIGAFHGDLTDGMYDLAFRSDGTLWGITDGEPPSLVTIDKATGAVTENLSDPPGALLAFVSDDLLVWTQRIGAEVGNWNVDTVAGADLGTTTRDYDGSGEIRACTYDGVDYLFAVDELSGKSNLYRLGFTHPTQRTRLIGQMFASGAPMDAIGFVGVAPAPPPPPPVPVGGRSVLLPNTHMGVGL